MCRKCVLIFALLTLFSTSGCMKSPEKVSAPPDRVQMGLPAHKGPRIRVAVNDLQWKIGYSSGRTKISFGGQSVEVTHKKSSGYTAGLRTMLMTALAQTRRYHMLDGQIPNPPKQDISPRTSEGGNLHNTQKGPFGPADLLVMGTVTGWEPGSFKNSGSINASPTGGDNTPGTSVRDTWEESSMSMDIRIVDAKTSKVLAASHVEGVAQDASLGGYIGVLGGPIDDKDSGLGAYMDTSMEKAIRVCLYNAVKYIVENTPQSYLKYR